MFHDDIDAKAGRSAAAPALADGFRRLYAGRLKRLFDILAILAAAPAALPLVALAAALVRLDGGPAFYGQERIGRGGRRFTCWKLRSMTPDAEARLEALLAADPEAAEEWERCQKLSRDPRVTPVGRFLRASSLDELPQLWNVLAGEMSLVGPRPMTPDQQHLYPGSAYYRLRPGITGFWQIGERHAGAFAARAAHDARYARELSFATDLGILARTVTVVLRGTGA